jgi:hypothetical protein
MADGKADGKRPATVLKLAEARERTPPVGALHAANLQELALGALTAVDLTAILQKQVEKAKSGDTAAAKFVLGYLGTAAARPAPVAVRRGEQPDRDTEDDPPPPVVVPSVAAEQLRRLAALYLIQNQPAHVAELARVTATEGDTLAAVLNCDWFVQANGRVSLTPAGRNAVG